MEIANQKSRIDNLMKMVDERFKEIEILKNNKDHTRRLLINLCSLAQKRSDDEIVEKLKEIILKLK